MEEEAQDAGTAGEGDVPICPGCMAENDPAADFCVKCGRPLSAIATTDPFRQTLSEGYWYRTAATGRIKPIVFWGTWLVFLPAIIGIALGVSSFLFRPDLQYAGAAGIIGVLLLAGLSLAMIALLWRMTRNYLAARRAERTDRE